MKIHIGTKVKFLNDVGGGVVKGFDQNDMVLVETQDGFEIPVKLSDLIVEEPAGYGFNGEEAVSSPVIETREEPLKETQISFEEKKYAGHMGEVLLALVPENFQLLHVSNFKLFLINDSNYFFHYVISFRDSGVYSLLRSGTAEPDSKVEIEVFSQSTIAKVKEFRLQGIFFKQGLLDPVAPVDIPLRIDNISFYKVHHFKENEYFHERALILKNEEKINLEDAIGKLKDDDIQKVSELKERESNKKQANLGRKKTMEEVDLHIEEIVDDHSGLSNGEIINLQITRFEAELEKAIRSNLQRIVFIHGVGNGRLKQEILKKLDRNYPELQYQDASFQEYGFGATMVYLK
jgi:hypothetical protein